MSMYEKILEILDKKGPLSIPIICDEINQNAKSFGEDEKPVKEAHIKSVISRKKELFTVKDDIVSILPEKEFLCLKVVQEMSGSWQKLNVDFIKSRFIVFEWHSEQFQSFSTPSETIGSVDELKKELYRMKIWDWESNDEQAKNVQDELRWSIKLETKGKTFIKNGIQTHPKEWKKLCQSISKLIGKSFSRI
ncbi:hypothetical protein [Bacillus sp. 03113]|uniref:hypothetical protein n=1 Tax=Bacillus sp. 03113 TaxID=2578211 RepID=UPI0011428307|nr:hypothetical protein [Bacillus sp. 03113]